MLRLRWCSHWLNPVLLSMHVFWERMPHGESVPLMGEVGGLGGWRGTPQCGNLLRVSSI